MKRLLCFAAAFLLVLGVAYADADIDVKTDYNREKGKIKISGEIKGAANGDIVSLMLFKPGKDYNFGDAEKLENVIVTADETTASEGKFSFDEISLSESFACGDYKLRISSGQKESETVIPVATPLQAAELMKNAASAEQVLELINKYNDVYGLEIGEGSVYNGLTDEAKSGVAERIAKESPENSEKLKICFNTHTALYKLYTSQWTGAESVISKYAAELGVETNEILSAYSPSDVYKSVTGRLFSSAEEFKNAYRTAISESKAPSSPGGGSGGGGGGSRGGGGTAYVPSVSAGETEKENKVYFTDIESCEWARESIEKLYEKGIINGRKSGIFEPDGCVTRAEAAKMIVLAFQIPFGGSKTEINDIPENDWAYPYASAAIDENIAKGFGGGVFGKDEFISRQDMAVMVYNAAKKFGLNALTENEKKVFSDENEIADYAKDAVSALSAAGVINGDGVGFSPLKTATRAQFAKIIAVFVK